MTQTALPKTINITATRIDNGYTKVTALADALGRHERTIREYIRLLHEDFGHPDFPEKLQGRSLNHRQQSVLAELSTYKQAGIPNRQICDFLMSDCSPRLTLNEACTWLTPHLSATLLTQFKAHFSP